MNANSEEHLSRSSGDSDSEEQPSHGEESRASVRSRQSAQDERSSRVRDSGSSMNSRISQSSSSSGSRVSSSSGFEDMSLHPSDDSEDSDNAGDDSLSGSRFQSEPDENSRDTSLFKDLQFASVVTIPDIDKAVTIRVTGTMTMDEYLKRVFEAIQHVNPHDSFDFEEYSLFNVEKSRWIEKRSRNIEVAGITISSPNAYFLRTTVAINVVLPNLKQVSMRVKANEKVIKVIKEICTQIGIKNKFEEFSLVENFQKKQLDRLEKYDPNENDDIDGAFETIHFPDESKISEFAIKPTLPKHKFENDLFFAQLNIWLTLGDQGITDGTTLYLRNTNNFLSAISLRDGCRKNCILTQLYVDIVSGVIDPSASSFLKYGIAALFALLKCHKESESKTKKWDPFAGGTNLLEKYKSSVKFIVEAQYNCPITTNSVSHRATVKELIHLKKNVSLPKTGVSCNITIQKNNIKIMVKEKENIDRVFNACGSKLAIVNRVKKTGKTKVNATYLEISDTESTMLLEFADTGEFIDGYLDLRLYASRQILKPLHYDWIRMREIAEDELSLCSGEQIKEFKSGQIHISEGDLNPAEFMPVGQKDIQAARQALYRHIRALCRQADDYFNVEKKLLCFVNYAKILNPVTIHTDLGLESGYDDKLLTKHYKELGNDKNKFDGQLVTFTCRTIFDHIEIIPVVPHKIAEKMPPCACIALNSIKGWRLKPQVGLDIALELADSKDLEKIVKFLELKPADNSDGRQIYELKSEISGSRTPYHSHEHRTIVRMNLRRQDNGKPVIREKDETYLGSGLTNNKMRHYVEPSVN